MEGHLSLYAMQLSLYAMHKRLGYLAAHTYYYDLRPDSEMSCAVYGSRTPCAVPNNIESKIANSPVDRQATIIVVQTCVDADPETTIV